MKGKERDAKHQRLELAQKIVRLVLDIQTEIFGSNGFGTINWNYALVNFQTDNLSEMIYNDVLGVGYVNSTVAAESLLLIRTKIADFLAAHKELVGELILCGSKYDPNPHVT